MACMSTLEAADATDTQSSCCNVVGEHVVSDPEAQRLAKVFKALGDPTRVKLLSLISASANAEMCVCDLTDPVGLSQPTVSHHMKQLVEAGACCARAARALGVLQPSDISAHRSDRVAYENALTSSRPGRFNGLVGRLVSGACLLPQLSCSWFLSRLGRAALVWDLFI